ncbi:alpha-L-fucosidase [Anaerolinea thermolimosa]|uniref:alpha-L-fucosidase n=1 Tax=Anaerolinea thermolimosa TaxID=229919 RepID=UPI0007853653|nr:alpha-L-fucosidase [Anaerolinea thermolimosa]GAP08062.1 alpha-L-fucosidase [Anaerolinea thermolimosa]
MTQPFQPTWESLSTYTVPDWYQDAKFGIFLHWGPYCVPAFGNEWYPRNMYLPGTPEFEHHVQTYGPQSRFGYKDFIPLFKAEHFDAEAWASLFEEAGAKYVVPVAEHHDGFAMYDTSLSRWCAARMGPRRDVLGELAGAVRRRGLVLGVSSHRAEHWWFMNGGRTFDSDVNDPAFADFYGPASPIDGLAPQPGSGVWKSRDWTPRPHALFLEDWLARCCELVDRYQPQVFWFDWWIEQIVFQPYVQRFAAYYYNRALEWGKGVAINFKNETFPREAAVWDIERGQLSDLRPYFWQTDTSVSKNSWGYVEPQDYKKSSDILQDLVDIVSKNGCMLLNLGPRADGTIPEPEQRILREIGAWLKPHGEAIYGTRPWRLFGEGPTRLEEGHFTDTKRPPYTGADLRFTRRGNVLYVIALVWPGEELLARSLTPDRFDASSIQSLTFLPGGEPLTWRQDADGLHVALPQRNESLMPVVRIECNRDL